jgi:hypothetical protein
MAFKVINIIDGDTIRVSPNWILGDNKGNIVKVKGYNTPTEDNQSHAIKKLSNLLKDKEIELNNARMFEPYSEALLSSVFLNGVDIATYFPEYNR